MLQNIGCLSAALFTQPGSSDTLGTVPMAGMPETEF